MPTFSPFLFWLGGFPKIDYRNKPGTQILTSLMEDLVGGEMEVPLKAGLWDHSWGFGLWEALSVVASKWSFPTALLKGNHQMDGVKSSKGSQMGE